MQKVISTSPVNFEVILLEITAQGLVFDRQKMTLAEFCVQFWALFH